WPVSVITFRPAFAASPSTKTSRAAYFRFQSLTNVANDKKKMPMNNIDNLNHCSARLTLLCVALALAGCGKPATKSPENNMVRTILVQPMDNSRSDGDAS